MRLLLTYLTAVVLLLKHQVFCTNNSVYSSMPTLDTDEEAQRNVRSINAPTKQQTSSYNKSLKRACDFMGWSLSDCLTRTFLNGGNKDGTIPSEIGLLTKLTFIAIWDARGTIPSTIGQLTNLKDLDISCSFNSSKMHGTIPSSIGKLTQLQSIYSDSCQFTGTIPGEIGRLTKLANLIMTENKFKSPFPNLSGLTDLVSLTLSNNLFKGKLSTSLAQLRKLTALDIRDNSFSGSLPLWLQKMSHLRKLQADKNKFSGDLKVLGKLTKLDYFSASGNQIIGSIPNTIGTLFTSLDLSKNYLSGTIPKLLPTFENLNISHNMLTGTMPSSLYLSENVDISKNMLTGAFGKLYGNNNPNEEKYAIRRFYLSDNQLTGKIAQSMIYLTNLIAIDLSKNQLTGPIPEFQSFWRLDTLNLSQNSFIGTIPNSLGDMYNFRHLDFSYNQLTGSIPSSIVKLTMLQTAYFENNVLIGSISNKFCALIQDDGYPKIAVDFGEVTCQCCTKWHEQ